MIGVHRSAVSSDMRVRRARPQVHFLGLRVGSVLPHLCLDRNELGGARPC
jgi:hypothetical protein